MTEKHDSFVNEYAKCLEKWVTFASRLDSLLIDLLNAREIDFHVVESRAKSIESLREKLTRSGKSYADPRRDVPDLVGVRIVLYDQEAATAASALIDAEFNVDDTSSSDKLSELAPDQFGYLSIHKVIRLSSDRANITEWKRFDGMHAEVQIRTVLQHAWASISHKLQYKRESEIPGQLRRRLTRLAGLFELADDEFLALRSRDVEIRSEIEERVRSGRDAVSLDLVSVQALAAQSDAINRISLAAADNGFEVTDFADRPDYEVQGQSQLLEVASVLRYKTTYEIDDALSSLATSADTLFAEVDFKMKGTASHFAAVLLIAANLGLFSNSDRYPFVSDEYIASIDAAGRKVFVS